MSRVPSLHSRGNQAVGSDDPNALGSFWILPASLVNLGLALLLLIMAFLKETPLFWRDAGGYPVALREMVMTLFYPLWLVTLILNTAATWLAWRWTRRGRLRGMTSLIMGLLSFLFLTLLTGIVVWNNLENLHEGRPWHWHPF